MSKEYLILSPSNPNPTFNRSFRNAKGEIVKSWQFQRGVPVEIEGEEMSIACMDDIGNVLLIATDDNGAIRFNPNRTDEIVLEIALEKTKAGKELTPVQKRAFDTFQNHRPITEPDQNVSVDETNNKGAQNQETEVTSTQTVGADLVDDAISSDDSTSESSTEEAIQETAATQESEPAAKNGNRGRRKN